MAGMLFAIAHVKVSKEKGKSRMIPTNWIDGGRPPKGGPGNGLHHCALLRNCWWPNQHQSEELADLVKERCEPNRKTWIRLQLKVLRQFRTYEEACTSFDLGIPLFKMQSIREFENSLRDSEADRSALVTYLSRIPDSSMVVRVRRTMREMITYELGKYFQYGPHKTNSFSREDFNDWPSLKDVIVASVRVTFPEAKIKDIEYRMKIWLESCLVNTR